MKKKYILPGILLILAGVYFFIGALPGIAMPKGAFLILIALALLVSRLFSRGKYGLTIAGFIVLWMGVARMVPDLLHISGWYSLMTAPLALSLAFFCTHIFEYRRIGNWPIVPGLVLLALSAMFFVILTPDVNAILKPYYGTILPLLLILLGVILLVRGARKVRHPQEPATIIPEIPVPEEPIPDPSQWAQPPLTPEEAASAQEPAAQPEPAVEPEPAAEEPETPAPEEEPAPEA